MVSLVWWILSCLGVCSFSWWPVFIEGIILAIISIIRYSISENLFNGYLGIFGLGLISFSALKLFSDFTVSPWWILLSSFWLIIALIIPGGLSLTYLWFDYMNVLTFSKGQLIFLIVIDTITLIVVIYGVVKLIIERRKERNSSNRF